MQSQLAKRIATEEAQRPDREAAREEGVPDGQGLGPEAERITVEGVVPQVAQHLAKGLKRELVPADESLLRYEADSDNVLRKVWLQGREVVA